MPRTAASWPPLGGQGGFFEVFLSGGEAAAQKCPQSLLPAPHSSVGRG